MLSATKTPRHEEKLDADCADYAEKYSHKKAQKAQRKVRRRLPPKRREKLVAGYELRVASYELRFGKLDDFGGRFF